MSKYDKIQVRRSKPWLGCRTNKIKGMSGLFATYCWTKPQTSTHQGNSRIQRIFYPIGSDQGRKEAVRIARMQGCKKVVEIKDGYQCAPLVK